MIDLPDTGDLQRAARESMDSLAARPGPRKLCQALALSEGFSFQIAVCSSPQTSAALQLWLARAVATEREASVSTERISPYSLDWRIPGPASIRVHELVDLVLGSLVGPQRHADLVFLDAARARAQEAHAWRILFERLNERRNLIVRDLRTALTLILPPGLEVEFARAAPDFWSIRSVSVRDFELADAPMRGATGFSADVQTLHLEQAIEQLPAPLRQIMLLRMADYSVDQIASALGLHLATVKTRHARALRMLRSVLGEEGGPF